MFDSFQSMTVEAALQRTLMSGVIQHFELTYELGWKFIKRWLSVNIGRSEVEGLSRRGLFRLAKEYQLIESIDEWMLFHAVRNETSHTYDENTAKEVFEISKKFLPVANKILTQLELNND